MKTLITKREYEVLQLISKEYSTKQIAILLHVSYETANSHRKNILKKLKAKNSAGLLRRAFELGLLKLNHTVQLVNEQIVSQSQLLRAI